MRDWEINAVEQIDPSGTWRVEVTGPVEGSFHVNVSASGKTKAKALVKLSQTIDDLREQLELVQNELRNEKTFKGRKS